VLRERRAKAQVRGSLGERGPDGLPCDGGRGSVSAVGMTRPESLKETPTEVTKGSRQSSQESDRVGLGT